MTAFPPLIMQIAQACTQAGGRALLVGGCVRDALRHHPIQDFDLEVYGIDGPTLKGLLSQLGDVIETGRAFGVFKLKHTHIDVALPRRDNKVGKGHRGFHVVPDPTMTFDDAARRRDLTINSMGMDPLTGEILDPFGGRDDLAQGILRATDATLFGEDPLRGLRTAQFAARFSMTPHGDLVRLCQSLDLSELAPERLFQEFDKLLLWGQRPSLGLAFLKDSKLLRFFPALAALVDVPQPPQWHPEGDVWTHTLLVTDEAARLRTGHEQLDRALMFGALCHDFGKPATTQILEGRIRSLGHEQAGIGPAVDFLGQLRAPKALVTQVTALVAHHLCPLMYPETGAKDGAYRRLARTLAPSGISMELLARMARADHLGRTTAEALENQCPLVDFFVDKADALGVLQAPQPPVVQGRHLLDRGLEPGPEFHLILEKCLALQDATGAHDPEILLQQVLKTL